LFSLSMYACCSKLDFHLRGRCVCLFVFVCVCVLMSLSFRVPPALLLLGQL